MVIASLFQRRRGVSSAPLFLSLAFAVTLGGCSTIGRPQELPLDHRMLPAETGRLQEFAAAGEDRLAEGESGLLLLPGNRDALDWRLAMVDNAQESIDAQYFLWDDDYTGRLMLKRLLWAADRGVQVRILVDDIFLTHSDRSIAALTNHPNMDIRIFNPNPARRTRAASAFRFMLEFRRLNRRMHNKLFIADGQVAITGGRNIGDNYFGVARGYNFRDLDVLVVGPVVDDMAQSFDDYWNSPYAFPGRKLHRRGTEEYLERVRERLEDDIARDPRRLVFPAEISAWDHLLYYGARELVPARVRFVADHPVERDDREVVRSLTDLLNGNEGSVREILIITPYFIPDEGVLEIFHQLEQDQVDVRLLVPSLASINHTAVHSHYRPHRETLLEKGVELFEYHHEPGGTGRLYADTAPFQADYISMHLKAVISGHRKSYVGSLNFDPRAMRINTENGLIIDSRLFNEQLRAIVAPLCEEDQAWTVILNPDGRGLIWTSDEGERRSPPARGPVQRLGEFLARLLPIANQL
ncbi:putative cardiolipin synthase [Alkalispirochaeta americana]|uniref:Putative cardiolipin synthase n=1 Tax=Alkalispirochaeta americana TaxID=159291 RepID=A0A1N6VC86_9SPIO|nr:phospholipase D family protein [Alkalispirochaeta americana]SIQ75461.1 putative cardiolipin synthase [Alkalispirochaeta americana]